MVTRPWTYFDHSNAAITLAIAGSREHVVMSRQLTYGHFGVVVDEPVHPTHAWVTASTKTRSKNPSAHVTRLPSTTSAASPG